MYLLVFSFLIIAMLGVYTQVFALQTARMFASESGVAQIMLLWQAGAVTLGETNKVNYDGHIGNAAGCSLSSLVANPGACPGGQVNLASGVMPAGYNFTYTWSTVAYQPGGAGTAIYVITWAPPPANLSSPITVPPVGISESDLFRQLQNTAAPLTSYGTVQNQILVTTGSVPGVGPVTYTLPTGNPVTTVVPNGSVAVISQL